MAQKLQKLGIQRVRPLQGGFHAWKDLGYPLAEPTVVAWHTAFQHLQQIETRINPLE